MYNINLMEKKTEEVVEVALDLRAGMAVKVFQKLVEGKKERIIAFQGKIIKSRGMGANKMVTVRQFVDGVDVDRIFPLNAPGIVKVENIEIKKKKTRKKTVKKVTKLSKKILKARSKAK